MDPFEEEQKQLAARELKRIFAVADRIYRRDRRRFQKLIVWIKTVQKRGYELRYIREALEIVDQREARGERLEEWWPYLMAALRGNRTKKLQGESEQYKKGVPNSVKTLMAKIFKEVSEKK